nr:AraC family transcriptional regulator [Burkholderia sp. RF4-BP95]
MSDGETVLNDCAELPCSGSHGLIFGPDAKGLQLAQASFSREAFSAHRHDTYAIGITVSGVQAFRYRREQHHCLPGQCHILHPDELHDGKAATEAGFAYRIAYIDPALVQAALRGRTLPFVGSPVTDISRLPDDITGRLMRFDEPFDDLSRTEFIVSIADFLEEAAGNRGIRKTEPLALPQLSRVRDMITAEPIRQFKMTELEQIAGMDRWTIARQFRLLFGASPRRFRTLRQLDITRNLLEKGASLSVAAAEAGFADQSHMTRHFKGAFGFTPRRWIETTRSVSNAHESR